MTLFHIFLNMRRKGKEWKFEDKGEGESITYSLELEILSIALQTRYRDEKQMSVFNRESFQNCTKSQLVIPLEKNYRNNDCNDVSAES